MSEVVPFVDLYRLQKAMRQFPQLQLSTGHYFADGMYLRTMSLQTRGLVVGRVHKTEHFFILVQGSLRLIGENGSEDIRAPWIRVGQPGIKRAAVALEDSLVITVHKVSSEALATSLEAIEKEIAEEDPDSMYLPGNVPKWPEIES